MSVQAKICGISTLAAALQALEAGAALLGFIHFAKSPRHVSLETMTELMQAIRDVSATSRLVSVVADPDDETLEGLARMVKPDLIQLHGQETPQRVASIRDRFNIRVIKALSIGGAQDLVAAESFDSVADYLLFDAKPPKNAALPGGLGLRFDWTLLRGYSGQKPWFLAGGLTAENVAEAVQISCARYVDVSSGVESTPGVKDMGLISSFLQATKAL